MKSDYKSYPKGHKAGVPCRYLPLQGFRCHYKGMDNPRKGERQGAWNKGHGGFNYIFPCHINRQIEIKKPFPGQRERPFIRRHDEEKIQLGLPPLQALFYFLQKNKKGGGKGGELTFSLLSIENAKYKGSFFIDQKKKRIVEKTSFIYLQKRNRVLF